MRREQEREQESVEGEAQGDPEDQTVPEDRSAFVRGGSEWRGFLSTPAQPEAVQGPEGRRQPIAEL